MIPSIKRLAAGAAVAALTAGLAACGGNSGSGGSGTNSSTTSGSGGGGKTIALLLPESKTARYESQDRPIFTSALHHFCPTCKLSYANADQDASKQQQQAEAALTNGAKVLVLDPVDAGSAASIVAEAHQQNVPVISYDRLINASPLAYYISYDNRAVGALQATSLTAKLKADGHPNGSIVMINGAPTDSNAAQFKAGALSVLNKSSYKIAKSYDTPDWSPDQAQTEMEQALTALGASGFVGVYAANDGTAGGAIAALRTGGVNPSTKPVTGQDAEVAGIQRIVAGTQYMTVYKAIRPEATTAAELAVDLANGTKPRAGLVTGTTAGAGGQKIPSVIFKPVAVTQQNIQSTILNDRFWTVGQICTSQFASACKKLNLHAPTANAGS